MSVATFLKAINAQNERLAKAGVGIEAPLPVDIEIVDHCGKVLIPFDEEPEEAFEISITAIPAGKFLWQVGMGPPPPPSDSSVLLVDAPEPPPMAELVKPVEAVSLPLGGVDGDADANKAAIAKLDAKLRAMREKDEPIIQSSRKRSMDADDELISEWMEANSGIFKR